MEVNVCVVCSMKYASIYLIKTIFTNTFIWPLKKVLPFFTFSTFIFKISN